MKTQLFVLAVASLIYCFAQVNPPAMAQAGSTGGTVGKQDKSVSGSEEPAEPKSQRNQHHAVSPPRESAEGPCKLASVWAGEVAGVGSSVWTISSDGTAIERGLGNAQGHASLSGHTLTIIFHTAFNNGTYVMQLSRTCSNGSGKTTILGGIPAGAVYTRTPSASD
ncbi:MAG: hypothetical protein WB760_21405 [Xanthobacteraceae bacterium]